MSQAATANMKAEDQAAALAASRQLCRRVARQRAANFYHGMKLVPKPKRSDMYALYAWMRRADDLTDRTGDAEAKRSALESLRRTTDRVLSDEEGEARARDEGDIWPAVHAMATQRGLPLRYLHEMIDGQLLDLDKRRYATFAELYDYCYKVASVVGLSCLEIWGYEGGAETRQLAEWRGIAFQLTNILRDVMEDAEADRVYVPAEDFDVYELKPAMFKLGKPGEVAAGLRKLADRAADYYRRSAELERWVYPDGRACLWAMSRIYRKLLSQIERDPAAVVRGERITLGKWTKGWIALRAVTGLRLGSGATE